MSNPTGPVLVFLPDRGIGDLMWHLPTIRGVAEKTGGKVILAARPATRAAQVLTAEPSVERVVYLTYHSGSLKTFREIADFWRLCRAIKPRAVWILEKIGRPAQAAALAGVRERHGFGLGHSSQERWLSKGPRLPKSMRPAHRLEKLDAFEALHGLPVASREPGLIVDPVQAAVIAERFGRLPRPWIGFGPGAVDAHRCWPIEHFARTADALTRDGGTVFWLGGPHEAGRFSEAVAGLEHPERSVVACDLDLGASAALMAGCAAFLGNDSGPMNVAAAVGTPTVVLYGASPALTYSRWLTALTTPTRDLRDITPDRAVEAVRRATPAPPPSSTPTAPS